MMKLPDDARAGKPGIIKVIGIGQSLRGDDAAGLEAVRLWQEIYLARPDHQNVQVELTELPGISLLSLLEGAQSAILVDAVHSQAIPGSIHNLSEDQLEAFGDGSGSAHGWGVAETLSLGRQITPSSLPEKLHLIGVEAGQLSIGDTLSPEVQSALPQAAELIEQFVRDQISAR